MTDIIKDWSFDLVSALITVVAIPVGILLLRLLAASLKKWGAYFVEGVLYWAARWVRHSFAGILTLKQYCRLQLSTQAQFLYVPSRLDLRLPIDQVFVTLSLESHGAERANYTEASLLEAGNRIIVVGDPGSGKSSLVKWLLRNACRAAVAKPSKALLPILIELKNLSVPTTLDASDAGEWLYGEVLKETSKARVYKMDECFASYSETSGLLVLLDGLDEVSTTDYSKIEMAILRLSSKLAQASQNNRLVLTTRLQFYQQIKQAYRDDFASTMFLKPFSPSDIYEFLSRWPFPQEREKCVARIYKDLTARPTLREMCRNPLVLSMYVAEDQASGSALMPETRTDFYSKVVEELIIRRRLQQKAGMIVAVPKLKEQRARILGQIALGHLLNGEQHANMVSWADAIKIVKSVVKCDAVTAEAYLRELSKETGIFTEERLGQTGRFIHLTLCEFLAAHEATQAKESGWEDLLSAHRNFQATRLPQLRSRLIEVIPFAGGLLPRSQRELFADRVASLGDNRLLARCFLETKLYEHESWDTFLESERTNLLRTPEENWDEEWLQRLYIFGVVMTDAMQCAQHSPDIKVKISLSSFFKVLLGRQRASLGKVLSAYASQDAAAAFRLAEVCGIDMPKDFPDIVVSNCDQKPFFDLARAESLNDSSRRRLWCSLLSEAALRSRVVAEWMSVGVEEALWEDLRSISREKCWHGQGLVNASFLTQCLTLACNDPIPELPLVRKLADVARPPGALSWFASIPAIFAQLVLCMLLFFATGPHAQGLTPQSYFSNGLAGAGVLILIPYFLLLRFTRLRIRFRYALYGGHALQSRELELKPRGDFRDRVTQIVYYLNLPSKYLFLFFMRDKMYEGLRRFEKERRTILSRMNELGEEDSARNQQ